jgi:hypothetical protein
MFATGVEKPWDHETVYEIMRDIEDAYYTLANNLFFRKTHDTFLLNGEPSCF